MKKLSKKVNFMASQEDRTHLSLMVMTDARKHGAEFLPSVLLEAEDDEEALGDFECPVEALTVLAAYPEVVARDVVETLGGVVKDGHLMMEGEGDLAPMAHLLNETDMVRAEDLPAAFAELQAEVEIHAVDEECLRKAAYGLPGGEAHHIASRDGMGDEFRA